MKKKGNKKMLYGLVFVLMAMALVTLVRTWNNRRLVADLENLYEADRLLFEARGEEVLVTGEDLDSFKDQFLLPYTYSRGALKGIEEGEGEGFSLEFRKCSESLGKFAFVPVVSEDDPALSGFDTYEDQAYLAKWKGRYYTFSTVDGSVFNFFKVFIEEDGS